jgi:hypothetical protein
MPVAYVAPRIRDYGDLVSLTADGGALMHVGIGGTSVLAAASAPASPGGGGGSVLGATQSAGHHDVLGGSAGGAPGGGHHDLLGSTGGGSPGGGNAGGGGAGAGHGGGGHGGSELPFTGFAAALVAAVGSGLAATGVAVRRALRRRES